MTADDKKRAELAQDKQDTINRALTVAREGREAVGRDIQAVLAARPPDRFLVSHLELASNCLFNDRERVKKHADNEWEADLKEAHAAIGRVIERRKLEVEAWKTQQVADLDRSVKSPRNG